MRRKSNSSESQRKNRIIIIATPKRKYKEECDDCHEYKYDVHGYYDAEDNVYILCPECMKKNKLIVKNWRNEPIEREENNDKKSSNKKTKHKTSKDDTNSSNTENGCKDPGQLLHSGVSRRKRSTEQSEHKPRGRKTTLI